MPSNPNPDDIAGMKKMSARTIARLDLDAQRKLALPQDCTKEELEALIRAREVKGQRPDRDLSEAKKWSHLQQDPWKLRLAIEMTWFARSTDVVSSLWNYDSLTKKLADADLALPTGLTIQQAVAMVETDLRADPRWYDVNIARPMGQRLSSTSVGTESMSRDDDDNGEWARGKNTDHEARQLATLSADFGLAATRLAELGNNNASEAAKYRKRGNDPKADEHEYWASVHFAAASAADKLNEGTSTELGSHIRGLQPDTHTVRAPEDAPLIRDAAQATSPSLAKGDTRVQYCRDIAGELAKAAVGSHSKSR